MQRWTPEISTSEWSGELKQSVTDAVITTDHAAELRLEGIKGVTEGDEHEARALAFAPRHRTPENKCARLKAFLLGAFNVRRSRRAIEFLVITTPAADRMILLALAHRLKALKIMQPLLHGDKRRAVETRTGPLQNRRRLRFFALRIFRAVFIAGEVAPTAVTESIDRRFERKRRCECSDDTP